MLNNIPVECVTVFLYFEVSGLQLHLGMTKIPTGYSTNVSAYIGLKYSQQHVLCLMLTLCSTVHFCLISVCNSKVGEILHSYAS
jgi:hypothetical protein